MEVWARLVMGDVADAIVADGDDAATADGMSDPVPSDFTLRNDGNTGAAAGADSAATAAPDTWGTSAPTAAESVRECDCTGTGTGTEAEADANVAGKGRNTFFTGSKRKRWGSGRRCKANLT